MGVALKENIDYSTLSLSQVEGRQLALDLCVRGNLFSYTVYAPGRQLIRFSVTEAEAGESALLFWLRSDEWLKRPYDQISVQWSGSRYTLVPDELAQTGNAAILARHSFELLANEQLHFEPVNDSIQLLYPVEDYLYYTFRSRFPNAGYQHLSSRILAWYLQGIIQNEALIVFHPQYLEFLYAEQDRLQICQSISFESDTEAVYHILNAMEQLRIPRDSATIHVIGLEHGSPLYTLLDTYIRKVKPVKIPLPEVLRSARKHHALLLNLL